MNPTRRQLITVGCALTASGCFGSFGATNALYDWNKDVSNSKWLRWLVFLVLIILPVYAVFIVADALILNTIEFFTGDNPVGGGQVRREMKDGYSVTSQRTQDPDVIRHEVRKDGELVRVTYVRRDGEMLWLLDEDGKPISRLRQRPDGSAELLDAQGQPLSVVSPEQQEQIARAAQRGGSPVEAAREALRSATGVALASRPAAHG